MTKTIPSNNLKKYREQISFSQQMLADASDVSVQTIVRAETGQHEPFMITKNALFQALRKNGALNRDGEKIKIQDVFPMED